MRNVSVIFQEVAVGDCLTGSGRASSIQPFIELTQLELKSQTSHEAEREISWKMAYNSVEHILGGEDIKAELKCRLRKHPWCPEEYQTTAATDTSPVQKRVRR